MKTEWFDVDERAKHYEYGLPEMPTEWLLGELTTSFIAEFRDHTNWDEPQAQWHGKQQELLRREILRRTREYDEKVA